VRCGIGGGSWSWFLTTLAAAIPSFCPRPSAIPSSFLGIEYPQKNPETYFLVGCAIVALERGFMLEATVMQVTMTTQTQTLEREANVPLALGSCVLNLLAILVEIRGAPVLRFMLNLRLTNAPCNDIFAARAFVLSLICVRRAPTANELIVSSMY
jgi:hypothetical protein